MRAARHTILLGLLLLVGGVGTGDPPASPAGETRAIHVRATLATEHDEPLAGFGVEVRSSEGVFFGETDAEGVAAIDARVGADEREVEVHLSGGARTGAPAAEVTERRIRLRALFSDHFYPYTLDRHPSVVIRDGQDRCEVRIVLRDAISIRAAVIDRHTEAPLTNARFVLRSGSFRGTSRVSKEGMLTARGAPRAAANELFVTVYPFVHAVSIGAEEAASDVDLGTIAISPPTAGRSLGEITITLADTGLTDLLGRRAIGGCTLISEDGRTVFSFTVGPGGRTTMLVPQPGGTMPRIPFGRYYLAPEAFVATDAQLGLLDALRAGRRPPDGTVPSIVVDEGEEKLAVEVDLVEVTRAVREFVGGRE